MADDVIIGIPAGSATIASDEIGGINHQKVKVEFGPDGTATEVSATTPMPVYSGGKGTGIVPQLMSRMLDTNGDGTGTVTANGDYSSGAEEFYIEPQGSPEEIMRIESLTVFIKDTGSMDADKYGVDLTLTNGITVQVHNGSSPILIYDLTAQENIFDSFDWGKLPNSTVTYLSLTAVDEVIKVDIVFPTPIRLEGSAGEKFVVTLNDNFTNLVDHKFFVSGYLESTLT